MSREVSDPAHWSELAYCREMTAGEPDRVRSAELIATLSLATDLALGVPLEHGLRSTLIAARLWDLLGVDQETAAQTYFLCLLFYVGCTASVDLSPEIFGDDNALATYGLPNRFGTRSEAIGGFLRALAPPDGSLGLRAQQVALGVPRLARAFPSIVAAVCEVGRMLTDRLGLPPTVSRLFIYESERWDGKGLPNGVKGSEIPLPVRIVHVARDAAFQAMLGDTKFVADVIRRRSGAAFDPEVANLLADRATEIFSSEDESPWEAVLTREPKPWLMLEHGAIDDALGAMGEFSDVASPYLVGHSSGVAKLAAMAAQHIRFSPTQEAQIKRAALVHDVGRVAVPLRIWEKTSSLTADDWEAVRLHAYHSERILLRSPFLAELSSIAGFHHERLDGSGYHRGSAAPQLDSKARLLAAADAYHAMCEPRPHRPALTGEEAAQALTEQARRGLFDRESVTAVLEVAGHSAPRIEWPAGLTEREVEVTRLLVRGMQTKQVARRLGISPKTADRHVQNAYRKMGVSTRAGASIFAMQHGLTTWGELPIATGRDPS